MLISTYTVLKDCQHWSTNEFLPSQAQINVLWSIEINGPLDIDFHEKIVFVLQETGRFMGAVMLRSRDQLRTNSNVCYYRQHYTVCFILHYYAI